MLDRPPAVLKKHGAGELESKIGLYNIKDPVVTASNPGAAQGETCYAMEAKTGAVRRKFDVCWTGETITWADDKGLKL